MDGAICRCCALDLPYFAWINGRHDGQHGLGTEVASLREQKPVSERVVDHDLQFIMAGLNGGVP